jgi:hypothetical protein
VPSNIGST